MLGKVKLDKLKTDMVQALYNSLHERGYSTTTIHIVHNVLSQAYDQAVKNELVYLNPCNATSRPKKEKKQVVAFTQQEQQFLCGASALPAIIICLPFCSIPA